MNNNFTCNNVLDANSIFKLTKDNRRHQSYIYIGALRIFIHQVYKQFFSLHL